jgi:signal transduction histidine kinase/ActR/RegA family two-component response regulator
MTPRPPFPFALADEVVRLLAVDWACVRLLEGDHLVLTAACGSMPSAFVSERVPLQGTMGGRVVLENRAIVCEVTGSSPALEEYVASLRAFGFTSYLGVPLRAGDQPVGVLSVLGRRPLTEEDCARAEAFARQAGPAVEHARLWHASAQHAERMEALADLGRLLSETLDIDVVGQRAVDSVCTLLSANSAALYRFDADTESLQELAHSRDTMLPFEWTPHLAPGVGIAGLAVRLRAPVASPNGLTDPRLVYTAEMRARVERSPYRAFMGVPLLVKDRILGALAVGARVGRVFSDAEIRLARSFADQTALALENARLFDDAARRGREAELRLSETQALLAVVDILSGGGPAHEVARRVAREVARALQADMVGVYELDASGENLVPVAGYHVPPALIQTFLTHPFVLAGFHEPWQAGRAAWCSDTAGDPRFVGFRLPGLASLAVLFAPVMLRGRPGGAIFAVWWQPGRTFTPSEIRLVEAVANQAGAAVENARLFAENRRQVEELTVLHEVARALTGQLDRAAVLDVIVSQVPRVFAVPSIAVLFVSEDGERLEIVAQRRRGVERQKAPEPCPEGPDGGLKRVVFDEGRAIRTDDYAAECARHDVRPVDDVVEFHHWMGVPLRAGPRVLGAITVATADRSFTEADERLLTNIADLAALALGSVHLFEERTRAYGELAAAQDQLVRTEKLRALGEMASGVAHDFNNLLAAILGRAQLLKQEIGDPRLTQWLDVIERAAFDGAQTVRRLQEFTRIRRDHPFVTVDLNRIAREALEITQSRWRDDARRRDVIIDVRTSFPVIPEVVGDPVELREALTNIILNAIDAMPGGGVLTVATSATEREVHLTVTDTGVGMTPAVRRRIFDPFFTTKGPQGTGLGLAMTYGIISRHRARIDTESQEGQGSTFRLVFPHAPPAPPPGPRRPEAADHVPSLRCLVVDDEETVGTLLGDILESGGHRAVVCLDGADAVARFRSEAFDVVFTDLAMPRLSGWQVARAMKAIEPDVPVFIVTGFGVELPGEESRAHGVDAVLVKPLSVRDVLEAAARAARARARRETSGQGRAR